MLAITRVIRARQAIGLSRATTKMRNNAGPAASVSRGHCGAAVLRIAGAFEAVKEHEQRRFGGLSANAFIYRVRPIKVNKITISEFQSLSPISDFGTWQPLRVDTL